MSANARIPIDLCDSTIKHTGGLKTLHEFEEEVKQESFQDEKRNTVYVAAFCKADAIWLSSSES